MQRFEDRICVVTGVGSGLGQAIARELAREGAAVVGCDVADDRGAATMDGIGRYRHADVSREADVAGLLDGVVAAHGRLDVMINNAAIQIEQELVETTEEQLDRILATNLKGVFFGCKHAVRVMRPAGGGVIVNVASVLALVADGILAAYCAAKGGVLGITRATAVQYGKDGIRCNAICPGDIDTPLVQAYFDACPDPDAMRAEVNTEYPLGRIGQPAEIARAALFLASDDASFMSGQPMVVDGGLLATVY
jgi:meso-butanediol dehydrogenase / (S,S)-butanediol dehydrogenase / diacetyl reductase